MYVMQGSNFNNEVNGIRYSVVIPNFDVMVPLQYYDIRI